MAGAAGPAGQPADIDREEFARALAWADQHGRKVAARAYLDPDDLGQVAMIAVWEASQRYRPEHGALLPFVGFRVRGAVKDAMRAESRRGFRKARSRGDGAGQWVQVESLDATCEGPLGGSTSLAEQLADPREPEQEQIDRREWVRRIVESLPPKERLVILGLYGSDVPPTMKELSLELGISESRVSQLHSQALDLLAQRVAGRRLVARSVRPELAFARARRERVMQMLRESSQGLTARQIAVTLKESTDAISGLLWRLHAKGVVARCGSVVVRGSAHIVYRLADARAQGGVA